MEGAMPVKKNVSKKKKGAKKRGGGGRGSGGSTVSYSALVAQVRLLNDWIHALKVAHNFGGWTIQQVSGGKPDPGGGPPGI
jgi:hypothetical protein